MDIITEKKRKQERNCGKKEKERMFRYIEA